MSPRWSWDFEDQAKPRAEAAAPGPPVPSPDRVVRSGDRTGGGAGEAHRPPSRLIQIRRRRAVAGAAALAVLAVVVAAAAGSGNGHSHHAATAGVRARAAKRPPSDPERDEAKAIRSVLAYTPFVRAGGGAAREIALTFDDGPGPYTPQVLAVLERYRVPATFFVIGKMLRYFGASTVREIEAGYAIGDHTESHPAMARLPAHEQYEELFEQIARVELVGGRRETLFRPPDGSFNATTMQQLARLHLLMVLWSVDTGDYTQPGASVIAERALAGAHPGAIILMHDAGGVRTQTVEALPRIIEGLRAKGYSLVTVPRMLADDPPPAGQTMPTSLAGG